MIKFVCTYLTTTTQKKSMNLKIKDICTGIFGGRRMSGEIISLNFKLK